MENSISSWEKQNKSIAKTLALKAKISGNALLEQVAEEKDETKRDEKEKNRRMVESVMYKALSNYENGDCEFCDCIKELCAALKVIVEE